jgi:CheY-like chemotaxis protein
MVRRATAKPLVIVVDDEPLLLRAWKRLFTGLPIRLRCCDCAAAALAAARAERPAVVVSDQHMSGMTGLELLARVRQDDPAVHVVLVTTDSDALQHAAREGFRGFDKSSPAEELRELVESLLVDPATPPSR